MKKHEKTEFDVSLETKSESEKNKLLRRKRIIAIVSIVIAVSLFVWLSFYLTDVILSSLDEDGNIMNTAQNFKELIESYGKWGVIVAFGIQVLQVIVSPIPGEVIEVGMGLCFGWLGGAVLCLVGGALAAALIMLFVKKYGIKAVELFVSTDKINELRIINNEKKLKTTVFLLYLIPGTPKDPLIFFFGLTKISIWDFIWIQTLARIPSVVTSTIAGEQVTKQNFLVSIIIFAVTGVLALIGMVLYRKIISHKNNHKEKDK
ncbi:MAG: TVP38/TMEM64 family protein [Clostridia bacterium]|nr:TVP38/TMEM64 family protein [Clostridia bacterium]